MKSEGSPRRFVPALAVGALGVVYGDIGTSPLYALRECFHGPNAPALTDANILGVLSLVFWSLAVVVSVKYLAFVMRADNRGEGGILSLLALALPAGPRSGARTGGLMVLGLAGAALLYGDGVLTPAVTVLSAVEGLKVATNVFAPYVVPISAVILVGLFLVQRQGTGRVGLAFGPVMIVWFLVLAWLGIRGVVRAPEVLGSVNPVYALEFFLRHGPRALVVLGSVFLVVTGAEALYADMGHFGARPIRQAWFALVLPGLFLNYLGQGALLLRQPDAAENPFYHLAPDWAQVPLVLLATAAAVIASQALISGSFSLTMQAVQLGLLPRMEIQHTSPEQRGQIFVPVANRALMAGCLALVFGFGSSSKLAAAYGIAVTLTMLITTLLFYFATRRIWGWSARKAGLWAAGFLLVDASFCGANLLKIAHGGWVPLVLGAGVFTIMTTWRAGRRALGQRLRASSVGLDTFLDDVRTAKVSRVPGTAIFMSGNPQGTPLALLHNLKHNKVLHERNILLTLVTQEEAHVDPAERLVVETLQPGFFRVTARYGFMDEPDVPAALRACGAAGLKVDPMRATFFLSSETILPKPGRGLASWRNRLFAVLSRNAQRATAFFHLPPNRVVELGMQVQL